MAKNTSKFIFYANLLFFSLLPFNVYAKDTESSNESDQLLQEAFRTELVYPQRKNELQLSFAPAFLNEHDANNTIFPLLIEYGLTNAWQVSLDWDAFIIHQPNGEKFTFGVGDFSFGTKYSFMRINGSDYHAALSFELTVPVASVNKGLSEGSQIYEPSLCFAKDFPNVHGSQVFGQIGFEFLNQTRRPKHTETHVDIPKIEVGESENEELEEAPVEVLPDIETTEVEPAAHAFFFNLGYAYPVHNMRYVIEVNWETNKWNHHGDENNLYLTPGLVWELPKNVELAAGGSVGLTKTSDRYDIFLRGTFEI